MLGRFYTLKHTPIFNKIFRKFCFNLFRFAFYKGLNFEKINKLNLRNL